MIWAEELDIKSLHKFSKYRKTFLHSWFSQLALSLSYRLQIYSSVRDRTYLTHLFENSDVSPSQETSGGSWGIGSFYLRTYAIAKGSSPQVLHHACALRTPQVEQSNERKYEQLEGFWRRLRFCESDNSHLAPGG